MRYAQHNFHQNFTNAAGNDPRVALDMFADSVVHIVRMYPNAVRQALIQSGVPAPKIPMSANSTRELINLVAENIVENADLQKYISDLMVQNSYSNAAGCLPGYSMNYFGQCIKGKKSGSAAFDGYASGAGDGAALGKIASATNPLGAVSQSVGQVFGWLQSKSDRDIAKEQTKQAMYNALASQQQGKTSQKGKFPTWGYFAIGIPLAGLATFFIVKMAKTG